ncbi:FkbM family methyltransferase [Sandaracinus amylolyticus]|uniref:FkbM family methyltransferase n=1 Tax=Sandaracinus amylolyticus TaxID=927083 RepID=UPI001F00F252|nr:FkbM family methyltransferase [Sandaracinus amylolyticus]UJR86882.1 Hypothetical protein I5071_89830 [Sandaracinus amylolyticus]
MELNETIALPRRGAARQSLDLRGASRFFIGDIVVRGGLKSYEPEVFAMMGALIETANAPVRLLDIGANVGVFSLTMAATYGPALRVTAFEPMPDIAEFVRDAASRNELAIDVREMALGARDERASFYVSSRSDASSSLNRRFRPHRAVIEVDVRTLESLATAWDDASFVLKIDTESTEPDVLEGGRAFIEKHRPPVICEVLAGRTEDRLWSFFSSVGYRAIHITGEPEWAGASALAGDPAYVHRDWLFAPAAPSPELVAAFREAYAEYGA